MSELPASRLSPADFARLREVRAAQPETIERIFVARTRRPLIDGDGRLMIVAADHPARGALGVRDDPGAMADRYELLERLAVALSRPGVDGVLGTPDILEDLAILGLLEGKIAVGSMNRGGLRGSSFEMDDRFTGYDADTMARMRLDFAKLLIRVNLQDAATAATLEATAQRVTDCAALELPVMLEPFMSTWTGGGIVNDLAPEAVIQSVAIASALGATSAYSWLKLPVVPQMDRVMAATTLPTLLLGGDSAGAPDEMYASWERAVALPGVRGLVVGRALLYPHHDDVAAAVDIASSLVHSSPVAARATAAITGKEPR